MGNRKPAKRTAKQLIHDESVGRVERLVPVCLMGKLQAEFEQVERELAEGSNRDADSLAGSGTAQLTARLAELREQMKDRTVEFRLVAMPWREWRKLKALHPPRKEPDGSVESSDRLTGVNTETFFPAAIKACLAEPELDENDWEVLDAKLTDNQIDSLSAAVWLINQTDIDVPFLPAVSKILRSASA